MILYHQSSYIVDAVSLQASAIDLMQDVTWAQLACKQEKGIKHHYCRKDRALLLVSK